MKMPKTMFSRLKLVLGLALACMMICACGPGTGGTGTGPSVGTTPPAPFIPLTFSGAQVTTAAAFGGSATGRSSSVFGPTLTPNRNAVLALDVQQIELRRLCQSFVFQGSWKIAEDGKLRLLGTYRSTRTLPDGQVDTITGIAYLNLTFSDGTLSSETISAVVVDSGQSVLMGPFDLKKTGTSESSLTTGSSCTGN